TENSGARFCRIDYGKTKGLIDRLRKIDAVVAIAAKEKCLVLLDWPAHLIAKLFHSDERLRILLCVLVPLIRVERLVSQKEETSSMKFTGPGSCCNRDRSSAVTSFFRSGIVRCDLILLDIVGRDAVQIAHRIGYRRFVRFNTVNRHVVGTIARAVDVHS